MANAQERDIYFIDLLGFIDLFILSVSEYHIIYSKNNN